MGFIESEKILQRFYKCIKIALQGMNNFHPHETTLKQVFSVLREQMGKREGARTGENRK